jgi:rubrerythrin
VDLERMMDRSLALERRAAAVYRSFATASRGDPDMCAVWTDLAGEEDAHARSVETARRHLREQGMSHVSIDGWQEALTESEERLTRAEQLGAGATREQRLAAALDLEITELDAFRKVLLAAAHESPATEQDDHAERLARVAEKVTDDPQVGLKSALLRAEARLRRHHA